MIKHDIYHNLNTILVGLGAETLQVVLRTQGAGSDELEVVWTVSIVPCGRSVDIALQR